MITLQTDDAVETRIGLHGDFREKSPVESARATGWGNV
jgi:hypothetical protein